MWAETKNLIRTFRSVCREGSTAEGLATLYAYESQVPAVAKSKIDGLKRFYKIDSRRALAYFEVHIQADEQHAAIERSLLAHYLGAGNAAAVIRSVEKVLDALWEMLSGVGRRHAIAC